MDSFESSTQYNFQLCDIDYDYVIVLAMQNARISSLIYVDILSDQTRWDVINDMIFIA